MNTPTLKWSLTGVENGSWTAQTGPSINPAAPTVFLPQQTPGEVAILCAGGAFGGALAKQSNVLPGQSKFITFRYQVRFGPDIAFGQVIETDTKFTDAAGWTYDGSFQWNVARGWLAQVNNPWVDTPLKQPLVADQWNDVVVVYQIDYVAHKLTVVSVNGQAVNAVVPAKQANWTKGQIVTQLQLCTTAAAGGYTVRFQGISYEGADSL